MDPSSTTDGAAAPVRKKRKSRWKIENRRGYRDLDRLYGLLETGGERHTLLREIHRIMKGWGCFRSSRLNDVSIDSLETLIMEKLGKGPGCPRCGSNLSTYYTTQKKYCWSLACEGKPHFDLDLNELSVPPPAAPLPAGPEQGDFPLSQLMLEEESEAELCHAL